MGVRTETVRDRRTLPRCHLQEPAQSGLGIGAVGGGKELQRIVGKLDENCWRKKQGRVQW